LKALLYITLTILFSFRLCAQTSLDTAANFTVKDVTGTTHRLNEYLEQDKIVVIDFFTITCGPCVTYAPLISESYTHFGCNTSNVIFLGINWGADNAGVTNFDSVNGVQYPGISGTEGNGNHVVADYGILSYPTVIIIKPDSYIAEQYIWPPSTDHLDSLIVLHGGILSGCTTPVHDYNKSVFASGRIVSVFPLPASDFITCITSVSENCSFEMCSVAGKAVTERISVFPGESARIPTGSLASGYYILILRNKSGAIIDSKPVIVRNL
jgi:thiol-disulfide isomerase/thioredoxin